MSPSHPGSETYLIYLFYLPCTGSTITYEVVGVEQVGLVVVKPAASQLFNAENLDGPRAFAVPTVAVTRKPPDVAQVGIVFTRTLSVVVFTLISEPAPTHVVSVVPLFELTFMHIFISETVCTCKVPAVLLYGKIFLFLMSDAVQSISESTAGRGILVISLSGTFLLTMLDVV
jgi:hypothetical protein